MILLISLIMLEIAGMIGLGVDWARATSVTWNFPEELAAFEDEDLTVGLVESVVEGAVSSVCEDCFEVHGSAIIATVGWTIEVSSRFIDLSEAVGLVVLRELFLDKFISCDPAPFLPSSPDSFFPKYATRLSVAFIARSWRRSSAGNCS